MSLMAPHIRQRLEASAALVVIGLIFLMLPARFRVGPALLVLAVEVLFFVPLWLTVLTDRAHIARKLALALTGLVTLAVAVSAALLIFRLVGGKSKAADLLRDAALIWIINLIVFAIWYWEIDGGGPYKRHEAGYRSDDFIFPQLTRSDDRFAGWQPEFVDYLFLAFNTSTAFSPTDTMVLSRRAKALLMTQSIMSLVVVAVIAARAVNTL